MFINDFVIKVRFGESRSALTPVTLDSWIRRLFFRTTLRSTKHTAPVNMFRLSCDLGYYLDSHKQIHCDWLIFACLRKSPGPATFGMCFRVLCFEPPG